MGGGEGGGGGRLLVAFSTCDAGDMRDFDRTVCDVSEEKAPEPQQVRATADRKDPPAGRHRLHRRLRAPTPRARARKISNHSALASAVEGPHRPQCEAQCETQCEGRAPGDASISHRELSTFLRTGPVYFSPCSEDPRGKLFCCCCIYIYLFIDRPVLPVVFAAVLARMPR
uniref:Uncharacterized protein n=1 Tax=Knipowitschia caucasica TaxID=637954 RepID=A0AAV2J3W4_KNICA